jgi:phytoene dehydrogenase-like protein
VKVAVIGAGPNGLTAAATLRHAGHDVVVLEARDTVGGLAAGEPVAGGPSHQGIFHDTHLVRTEVIRHLGLKLKRRATPAVHTPDGVALKRPSSWTKLMRSLRPMVDRVVGELPPETEADAPLWPLAQRALDLRRLGAKRMMEVLRIGPCSLDDFVTEHFDDPAQAALIMPPGLLGAFMGPLSPTGTAHLLLHETLRGKEVVGGPAAVVAALAERAGEIRTGARVSRIEVDAGKVTGVTLASGDTVAAEAVVSCLAHKRTMLDLVPAEWVPPLIARDVEHVRHRGIHAKVHLVTASPLFPHERVRIGATPLDLERAFDDAKHRRLPTAPTLDIRQQGAVTSILVFGAAYDLDGGWTDEARTQLGDAVLRQLAKHVPDVRERVTGMEVLTPADLETRFGLEGGHLLHGEVALDQLWFMRPVRRLARARAGIAGLYLGSHGMHPGLAMTLQPGWLAARAVLDDIAA